MSEGVWLFIVFVGVEDSGKVFCFGSVGRGGRDRFC